MSFPTDPPMNSAELRPEWANVESETVTLKRQVRWRGGQRWAFTGRFQNMTRRQARSLTSFLMAQRGSLKTFLLRFPRLSDNEGDATGICRVNNLAGYPAGTETLNVDGHAGTIEPGFLTFANHSKAYWLEAARSGAGAITISPPLFAAVGDNEAITYNGVQFTCRIENRQRYTFPASDNLNGSINFFEDV